MGKKGRRRPKRGGAPGAVIARPFVSLCTPTFNRRPFIAQLVRCVQNQTYPSDRMEWIILDDGTDPISDLLPEGGSLKIRYFRLETKRPLGAKRNYLHGKCSGDIVVNIDDDDYYPPDRVAHAVETLNANPEALCAGSSAVLTYFQDTKRVVRFGPYGPQHTTAATMAFRRALLSQTRCDPSAALAEEKTFLRDYAVPLVQLDPRKTILVIAHEHNTFDKRRLLEPLWGAEQFATVETDRIEDLIQDEVSREFYTEGVHEQLRDYPAGKPESKPDVLKQFAQMEADRRRRVERKQAEGLKPSGIAIQEPEGERRELSAEQVVSMLKSQREEIESLKRELGEARDMRSSRRQEST
jgi:hypothetical protein